ncbi:DNA-processing protein DprA [Methylocapsa sp. S129]|uniref:DNA-processing protein DprA n=1 Tax=Methylocapsa sp. S129 TaxID=1641869 RepID=UPI001FEFFD12|nr:DNA-processing protein DprA [Methylocapsa sp. S129]
MAVAPKAIRLTDAQRFDWLRLIRSENVGPRTFRALIRNCGGAGAALKALPEMARRGGAAKPIRLATVEEIERELTAARHAGARFIALDEPDYPAALRQIDSAPPIIALRGREEALQQPAVAIVGSRNASGAGLTFTERLARGIGRAGYVIVSGLARGIDQRAHLASLETGTIAVLAGGHARPYPAEAAPLIARIAESGGAIISEMPIEWEPRGRDFPRRNRIVSGMALGTVIVEAARGSGSLITARFAAEQNREVFAVPGSPLDPRAEGTNDLLRDGANLCARAEDVLNVLDPVRARDPFSILREGFSSSTGSLWDERDIPDDEPGPAIRSRAVGDAASASLDLATRDAPAPVRARILELLSPSPISIDELVRAADAPIKEVRIVLLELELAGKLEYSGGARVALSIPRERD